MSAEALQPHQISRIKRMAASLSSPDAFRGDAEYSNGKSSLYSLI
jgi:hypothetical protein